MDMKEWNQQKQSKSFEFAFANLCRKCRRLVLPVLNEVYGTSFLGNEKVRSFPDKTYWIITFGQQRLESLVDMQFMLEDNDGKEREFQLEFQSTPETTLWYKMMYASDAFTLNPVVDIKIPEIALVYLRINDDVPEKRIELPVNLPDGYRFTLDVPVLKVPQISLDELVEKKLYLLLPFHIFAFEEELKEMEMDPEKRQKLVSTFERIKKIVEERRNAGELKHREAETILGSTLEVAKRLVADRGLRKELRVALGFSQR